MPDENHDAVTDERTAEALVVCIGNDLVADDAIGYEIYKKLCAMGLPRNIRIEFAGVGGLALLDSLQGGEDIMIVVDAVQFGAEPGTVHCCSWDQIPSFGNPAISVHGIGLAETIGIGKILYPERIPPSIFLVGIEGRCFNRMRHAMTPETEAAADTAVALICKKLLEL